MLAEGQGGQPPDSRAAQARKLHRRRRQEAVDGYVSERSGNRGSRLYDERHCPGNKAGKQNMSELIREVNDDDFEQVVLRSDRPVLVDFRVPWCGPCRALAPVLEKLAAARANGARVVKLNVDTRPISAERFAIRAIPTLVFFKSGREVERLLGAANGAEIARKIDHHIDPGANGEKEHGIRTA